MKKGRDYFFFMNSIEKAWKKFLEECLDNGEWVIKDDGDQILEIRDNHCFIPNILTNTLGASNVSLDLFLDLIGEGVFNIEGYPICDAALESYVRQLDDPHHIYIENNTGDDSFVYTYPERLYNIHQVNREGIVDCFNQVDTIINRLREHKGSNRGVANLYMCALDRDEQHIPCLNFVQCLIRDNGLELHVLFRSNDLYGAFCSNMLFLQYLGLKITHVLKDDYPGLFFKGIFYNSTSLHIYQGDFEQAKQII